MRNTRRFRPMLFLLALGLTLPLIAVAAHADGALDPHFGNGGVFIPSLPTTDDLPFAIAIDAADEIYLAGGGTTAGQTTGAFSFVAAIHSTGSFDPHFGNLNGAEIIDLGTYFQQFTSIVRDTQGRFVVAGGVAQGVNGGNMVILRFLKNGQLDTSFGTGGKVVMQAPGSTYSSALAITLDNLGNIVVAGVAPHGGKFNGVYVARFTPNGQPDSSFGTGGFVYPDFGSDDELAYAVAVDAQDRVIIAGYSSSAGNVRHVSLGRFLRDGSPDPTFGSNGEFVKVSSDKETVRSLLIDSQNRIVVGGTRASSNTDFFIDRFTTGGQLDSTFGNGGETVTDLGGSNDQLNALSFDRAGHIIAVGYSDANGKDDVAVARYTTNGALDSSFGSGGEMLYGSGGANEIGNAVTVDSQGRIIVAGYTDAGGNDDIITLAINASGGPAPGTCGGNPVTSLCVDHNRFRLQVRWQANGQTGSGAAIPFTDESGFFWFFNPNNLEMMTKVHDACKLASHQWLFGAATTNVHYVLTATDTLSGKQVAINNPAGKLSPAISDQKTFNDCF